MQNSKTDIFRYFPIFKPILFIMRTGRNVSFLLLV
jgi:hypothetical protein